MVVWKNTTDGVQDNGLTLNGNSTGTVCSFTARSGWIHLLQHIAEGPCHQAEPPGSQSRPNEANLSLLWLCKAFCPSVVFLVNTYS